MAVAAWMAVGLSTGGTAQALEGTLALEVPDGCLGGAGDVIEVGVWMRDLTGNVTGFQAFLAFDDAILTYRGDLSFYSGLPFPMHIQDLATAEVAPGQLNLDGSTPPGDPPDPGTSEDSLLATLKFEVLAECVATSLTFRDAFPFISELSAPGVLYVTILVDMPSVMLDDAPPAVTCPTPMGVECTDDVPPPDPGSVTALDNCDPNPVISYEGDAGNGGAGCLGDPLVITRSYQADDACGNTATCTQTITVVDTLPPAITCPPNVVVEFFDPGDPSLGEASATDNCDPGTLDITFSDSVDGGDCPQGSVVTRTWTATDGCGNSGSCEQVITVLDFTPPPPVILDENHQGRGNKGEAFRPVDEQGDPAVFLLTARSSVDHTDPFDPDAPGQIGTVYVDRQDREGTGVQTSDGGGSGGISGGGGAKDEELIFTFDAAVPAASITLGLSGIEFGSGSGDKDDPVLFFSAAGSGVYGYTVLEDEIEDAFTPTGDKKGDVDFAMLDTAPPLPPGLLIEAFKIRETNSHLWARSLARTVSDECIDCNNNGVPDDQDIADGTSLDCNNNGIPDECEYPGCPDIRLADMNCDGLVSGGDIQGFVDYLVAGRYTCQADMDQNGAVDLVDIPLFVNNLLAVP